MSDGYKIEPCDICGSELEGKTIDNVFYVFCPNKANHLQVISKATHAIQRSIPASLLHDIKTDYKICPNCLRHYSISHVCSNTERENLTVFSDNIIRKYKEDDPAIMKSDLAWCLGKLRGLGHANEDLEKKYKLREKD